MQEENRKISDDKEEIKDSEPPSMELFKSIFADDDEDSDNDSEESSENEENSETVKSQGKKLAVCGFAL